MATGTVSEALWHRFSRSNDGTLAIVLEDSNHPRDVWVGRVGQAGQENSEKSSLVAVTYRNRTLLSTERLLPTHQHLFL